LLTRYSNKQRGALRGIPETIAHSPSQMPLSCPVAPPSQRKLRKDGGGGGGGVARRARRPGPERQSLRHVLWRILRSVLRRVLHVPVLNAPVLNVLVLHVPPKGSVGGGHRWKMTRAMMNTFALPPSAAPCSSSATPCVTSFAMSCAASFTCLSFTCSSFTCRPRASVWGGTCVCWV